MLLLCSHRFVGGIGGGAEAQVEVDMAGRAGVAPSAMVRQVGGFAVSNLVAARVLEASVKSPPSPSSPSSYSNLV